MFETTSLYPKGYKSQKSSDLHLFLSSDSSMDADHESDEIFHVLSTIPSNGRTSADGSTSTRLPSPFGLRSTSPTLMVTRSKIISTHRRSSSHSKFQSKSSVKSGSTQNQNQNQNQNFRMVNFINPNVKSFPLPNHRDSARTKRTNPSSNRSSIAKRRHLAKDEGPLVFIPRLSSEESGESSITESPLVSPRYKTGVWVPSFSSMPPPESISTHHPNPSYPSQQIYYSRYDPRLDGPLFPNPFHLSSDNGLSPRKHRDHSNVKIKKPEQIEMDSFQAFHNNDTQEEVDFSISSSFSFYPEGNEFHSKQIDHDTDETAYEPQEFTSTLLSELSQVDNDSEIQARAGKSIHRRARSKRPTTDNKSKHTHHSSTSSAGGTESTHETEDSMHSGTGYSGHSSSFSSKSSSRSYHIASKSTKSSKSKIGSKSLNLSLSDAAPQKVPFSFQFISNAGLAGPETSSDTDISTDGGPFSISTSSKVTLTAMVSRRSAFLPNPPGSSTKPGNTNTHSASNSKKKQREKATRTKLKLTTRTPKDSHYCVVSPPLQLSSLSSQSFSEVSDSGSEHVSRQVIRVRTALRNPAMWSRPPRAVLKDVEARISHQTQPNPDGD